MKQLTKKKPKLGKKIEKNGPISHLKRIIKLSKTFWRRFQMVAFLCGIEQNLLLQKTKLQFDILSVYRMAATRETRDKGSILPPPNLVAYNFYALHRGDVLQIHIVTCYITTHFVTARQNKKNEGLKQTIPGSSFHSLPTLIRKKCI